MGYRNYIGRLPKSVHEEVKDLTEQELTDKYGGDEDEEDRYFWPYEHLSVEEIYECGKYCDERETLTRFFTHKMNSESDGEFMLGSKDLLNEIIIAYHKSTTKYYKELLENDDIDAHIKHARDMLFEWDKMEPYSLDIDSPKIVSSWKYEYEIFELVRIMKTFDWENDVLVYYGH
jgi:hypothetical protein